MSDNPTALITGASSGIGEAYARELALRGYDLVLVARRREKLQALAGELSSGFQIQAEPLVADLTSEKDISTTEKRLAEGVDLLVNNAGFGTTGAFVDVDPAKQNAMIKLQAEVPIRLSRAALPAMIKQRSGGIINISSISSFYPVPSRTVYGATKAAMNQFSASLAQEVGRHCIHVQSLAPGFTYTEFHDSPEFDGWSRDQVSKAFWMTADEVVKISLAELERNRRVIVIPGWRNRVLVWLSTSPLTRSIMQAAMSKKLNDANE